MMIEINRFLTLDEIRAAYGLPEQLAGKILPILPVALVLDDGTSLYLESQVDQFLAEFVRRLRLDEARSKVAAPGEQGRKNDTTEIAVYANELRRQRKTWKEVFRACRERWPNDDRVNNQEQIRKTWDRHFGPKHRMSD